MPGERRNLPKWWTLFLVLLQCLTGENPVWKGNAGLVDLTSHIGRD